MSVRDDYRKWNRRRAVINRYEESGRQVRSSEWEWSDDTAVDLLETAMSVLDNVTATLHEITEALCMGSWTCSEAEAVYEMMLGLGLDDMAEHFMLAHADSDSPDEGDLHRVTDDDKWERVDIDDEIEPGLGAMTNEQIWSRNSE